MHAYFLFPHEKVKEILHTEHMRKGQRQALGKGLHLGTAMFFYQFNGQATYYPT